MGLHLLKTALMMVAVVAIVKWASSLLWGHTLTAEFVVFMAVFIAYCTLLEWRRERRKRVQTTP